MMPLPRSAALLDVSIAPRSAARTMEEPNPEEVVARFEELSDLEAEFEEADLEISAIPRVTFVVRA